MEFVRAFAEKKPEKGQLLIAWLGQAGFLLKNSRGHILAVDIYLSDLAERQDGNKRLIPSLFQAGELQPDVLLASHHHADHLDLDSIPAILEGGASLYCCQTSYKLCKAAGFPMKQVTAMSSKSAVLDSGFEIEAVYADHGELAPDALGFCIRSEEICIYFTGDTSYQWGKMKNALKGKSIDILILPINGEYGNMNERDGAMLVAKIAPSLTIPCHFWTFARHKGSPYDFQLEVGASAPDCPVCVMAQGEILLYPPKT